MIAVIFEFEPHPQHKQANLDTTAALKPLLECIGGFRQSLFADYPLRIAQVIRDYGMKERAQAPEDSRKAHHA